MRFFPLREQPFEGGLRQHLGHIEHFALFGGLDGVGADAVERHPAHLGEARDHRLDRRDAHLGRLLDDVVEPRGFQRRKAVPEVGSGRLDGDLLIE